MQTRSHPPRSARALTSGYSVLELVLVIVMVGIIGGTSFFVVLEAMRVYARAQPQMEASYVANLVASRMTRDIRDIPSIHAIQTMDEEHLVFESSAGDKVFYEYSDGFLSRNGAPLAEDLKEFAFSFESASGVAVDSPDEVHLIRLQLVSQSGNESVPMALTVFPRGLQR